MPGTDKKSREMVCCMNSGSHSSVEMDDTLAGGADVQTNEHSFSLLTEKERPDIKHLNTQNNNNTPFCFPRRDAVDLAFSDVVYDVRTYSLQRPFIRYKRILKGVTGEFKAGHLSAIMGPSGAGKSTLLNILAGYVDKGVSGSFLVNESPWNRKKFSHLSCYIMQDDELREPLTIRESMTLVANLKLGTVSVPERQAQIDRLLEMLGLLEHQDTRSKSLSGGQKKRLSIALELVSNPPVIFLDEPTTGLDSLSCTQTVSLLKTLAQEGRTVVCTIHQPSALIFEMFDHLYALSEGMCVYQGSGWQLVPFLAKQGYQCPPYHNPADFLLEVASGEYGCDINKLSLAAQNIVNVETPAEELQRKRSLIGSMEINTLPPYNDDSEGCAQFPKRAGLLEQFRLLYIRNLVIMKRCYSQIFLRLLSHLILGVIFGYFYSHVGTKANLAYGNVVYIYGTTLLLAFTGKMAVVLMYPLEYKIVVREYFNQWYSLGPYTLSYFLIEIPVQIISCLLYLSISYHLTGQTTDPFRMGLFYLFSIMASLTAQSMGYIVGLMFSVKVAVFVGPVTVGYLSNFGFSFFYSDIPWVMKWLFYVSYMRSAFQSNLHLIYGFNRELLPCDPHAMYCHMRYPTKVLEVLDAENVDIYPNLAYLIVLAIVFHFITIYALWHKLTKR